jgi:hypothetical protein
MAGAITHPVEMTATRLHQATATPHDRTAREPGEAIDIPDRITSPQAKLVYLYLHVRGTVTVDELGTALGLPKLALFSILETLDEYDTVARDGDVVSLA